MKAPHLDSETIYELAEGRLEPGRERAAEAHLWRCDACRALREECVATLEALRLYGERIPEAPAGYWEGFWSRWPLAGEVAPNARRRARRLVPALAAAAVLVLAIGLWRTQRDGGSTPIVVTSVTTAVPAREIVAGTSWEGDVEMLERMAFAVGGVDPLSKGVVLASMAEAP